MTRRVEALEGQLEPPPTEERAQELAALRDQHEAKTQNISSLEGQIEDHTTALRELSVAHADSFTRTRPAFKASRSRRPPEPR